MVSFLYRRIWNRLAQIWLNLREQYCYVTGRYGATSAWSASHRGGASLRGPLTAFLRGHDRHGAALERENERADRRDIPAPSHRQGAGCCDTSMGGARQCRMAGQSLRW